MGNTRVVHGNRADEDFRGNDRVEVRAIKTLIRRYLAKNDEVSLDTVYSDSSEPRDLPMYEAAQELLDEGIIEGPPVDSGLDHTQLVYRLVPDDAPE